MTFPQPGVSLKTESTENFDELTPSKRKTAGEISPHSALGFDRPVSITVNAYETV